MSKAKETMACLDIIFNQAENSKTEIKESVNQNADDPYEELKKTKELLDMGIITQEEFDAKKKQLLGL